MAHFRLTLILIACILLRSGAAVAQAQDTAKGGMISGAIQDTTLLENPLSGVRVVFVHADGTEFETQTDKDGHYTRSGLPAGEYVVNTYKAGYQDRLGNPVSVIDNGRHYVPMTMNRLGIDKNLDGVLRFSARNRTRRGGPIEGLEIKITGEGPDPVIVTGTSDTNGRYRSEKLAPGGYLVTLSKDDYYAICPMTVHAGKITHAHVDFSMPDENAEPNLSPTQESEWPNAKNVIRGRIGEMIPGYPPLSDVKIVIESANRIVFSDTSNADGEYECRGLSAGRYLISLSKEGYIDKKGIPLIVVNNGNHGIGIIEEGMFPSYASIADGGRLKLTHGMRKK